jgi:hypothetical protein
MSETKPSEIKPTETKPSTRRLANRKFAQENWKAALHVAKGIRNVFLETMVYRAVLTSLVSESASKLPEADLLNVKRIEAETGIMPFIQKTRSSSCPDLRTCH